MEGFKKLSETPLVDDVNKDASVLVEDSGEIKRVPKLKIGAQADWNETDTLSPAFILNKPQQLNNGGIGISKFFHVYGENCVIHVRDNDTWVNKTHVTYNIPDDVVDYHEFEEAFMNSLCLVSFLNDEDYNCKKISVVTYFSPYDNDSEEYSFASVRFRDDTYVKLKTYYEE